MQCCVLQEALMNFVPPTLVPGVEGRFQAASAGGQFARFSDSGTACGVWLPGLLQALLCTGLCPAKLCLCRALPCAPGCLSPAAALVLAVPSVLCQQSPQGQLWGHCCLSPPAQLGHKARSYPGQERAGAFSVFGLYFPGGKSLLGCRKSVEVRSYPAAAGARVQQWAGHQLGACPVPHRSAGCWCGGRPCPGLTWPYKSREESKL